MPSEVSTKRKVIGGAAIALGTAETTIGVALTAAGSAPVPNPLLIPGLFLIGKGCTTTSAGIATITNFKKEESRIDKFLRTNPTIPTVRVPKANVTPIKKKETLFNEFLILSGLVSTRRSVETGVIPDYIGEANNAEALARDEVLNTRQSNNLIRWSSEATITDDNNDFAKKMNDLRNCSTEHSTKPTSSRTWSAV